MVAAVICTASWAYAQSPIVTFQGGPLAPVLCPTAPDQVSLTLVEGTWVNVVNQTGAAATMEVDGLPSQTIPLGSGLSVKLPVGHHDLRLIPHCPTRGKLLPVAIDIVAAVPAPSSQPAPSGEAPAAAMSAQPSVMPSSPDRDPPGLDVGTGKGPGRGGTAVGPSDSPAPRAAPAELRGIEVVPYAVPETEDPRGSRLLAVVGAICVFGVTAAIIRAILAERSKRLQSL
jgi:hypothetical protein